MDKQLLAVPAPNTYAADKLDLLPKPIALDMSKQGEDRFAISREVLAKLGPNTYIPNQKE